MSSLNGQFISNVTKNIYNSDPSFFRHVFNYNEKNGQVTFKQVLVNKATATSNVRQVTTGAPATMEGYNEGYVNSTNSSTNTAGTGATGNVGSTNSSQNITNHSSSTSGGDLDKIFQEAAEKYNVDVRLLKAIGKVESGFNPKAVSPAGAKGIMQLMPANCKEYGITDPFDPRQNIMGGAREISGYLKKYNGNLDLALAAYNAGPGNVAKYGGVPPFKETQNFIKKVRSYMQTEIVIGGSHGHVNKKDEEKANERLDKITYDKNVANIKIRY